MGVCPVIHRQTGKDHQPGPLTIADTLHDEHYGDKRRLGSDISDALNREVLGLAERGCRHIQIDEPVFVRQLENASEFGFENLDRAFHGCPPDVVRTVHMCCSYPDSLVQLSGQPGAAIRIAWCSYPDSLVQLSG